MIQKNSTSAFKIIKPQKVATKNNCVFDTRKQNARNAQWNAFKMKKILKHRHKQTELEI